MTIWDLKPGATFRLTEDQDGYLMKVVNKSTDGSVIASMYLDGPFEGDIDLVWWDEIDEDTITMMEEEE